MIVVDCGSAQIPAALQPLEQISTDVSPTRAQLKSVSTAASPETRLIICGTDASFAAILTRLMRAEQLRTEVAFVTTTASPATTHFGLPLGDAAAALALNGLAQPVPLLRDDTGTAIVATAFWRGPEDTPLEGQVYADSEHVHTGVVDFVEILATHSGPGLQVATSRRHGLRRRRHWFTARATQYGGPGAIVVRDGVAAPRPVKRSSVYRHLEPMHLVIP